MCDLKHGNYTSNEKTEETEDLRLGIFFDGTLNNKNNTLARTNNLEYFRKYGKKDSSYMNDLSNIARLWEYYELDKRIYVEGIGTEDYKTDSTIRGGGFGAGSTGIPEKMQIGCDKVVEKTAPFGKIRILFLDVFGFSRGAAAARHFVYEVSRARERKDGFPYGRLGEKLNGKVEFVLIRFLGLFDTVSSYLLDFSNDVEQLHLNNIGNAWQIVHFTAENEHRQNFSLTRLPTHIGIEKEFPGVHCDIGGSYNDGEEVVVEIETQIGLKKTDELILLKNKLIEEGWFLDDDKQLTIDEGYIYSSLNGNRDLKKDYSYIPLHFMAELGIDTQEVPFDKSSIESKYVIESKTLLERVKDRLREYVFDASKGPYHYIKNSQTEEQKDLKELRNKYLHWSSNYEGALNIMAPEKDRIRTEY